jgi:hypothetical protein
MQMMADGHSKIEIGKMKLRAESQLLVGSTWNDSKIKYK